MKNLLSLIIVTFLTLFWSPAMADRRPLTATMTNLEMVDFDTIGPNPFNETAFITNIESLGVLREEGTGLATMSAFRFTGENTEPNGGYSIWSVEVHFSFLRPRCYSDANGGTAIVIEEHGMVAVIRQTQFISGQPNPRNSLFSTSVQFKLVAYTDNWTGTDFGENELKFSIRSGFEDLYNRVYTFRPTFDVQLDPQPLSPADFDQNGVVNGIDLLLWMQNHGSAGTNRHAGDANHDYQTNGRDFLSWQQGVNRTNPLPSRSSYSPLRRPRFEHQNFRSNRNSNSPRRLYRSKINNLR